MSSFKEPTTSRPLAHHRVSSSSAPLNVPARHVSSGNGSSNHHHHHRQHAHSVSLGALHHGHNANRVTRRKSLTANHLAAAVQHINDASLEALVSPESRVARRADKHPRSVSSASQPRPAADDEVRVKTEQGAGPVESSPASRPTDTKGRNRRASEGASLTKDGKRVSGELRCDKCGKGYKHSSCLTKHLWEHTPEWAFTSKLLISKHQQVQLLEAASVLVTMNQDPVAELAKALESDRSSASPEASGSSEVLDEDPSSVETTPPPMSEAMENSKRYSATSSAYSRSYQSMAASSMPSSSYGSYHYSTRPSTSGTPYSGLPVEDEAGLAAAVKLVNFGTPRSVAQAMDDVPPVPPLPARYAAHGTTPSMNGFDYTLTHEITIQPLHQRISDERDSKMPGASVTSVDIELEDRRSVSRGHSEHEDGFFGRMEE